MASNNCDMMIVLIVGVGNIGFRHLQAINNTKWEIHICDPSLQALNRVKEWNAGNTYDLELFFHESLVSIPSRIDIVIVATTSKHRMKVLEELINISDVDHLILEKFLFTTQADFENASKLLKGRSAYVNCTRREWNVYKSLKDRTENHRLEISVYGSGAWIASNGIHFADLLYYLTGATIIDVTSIRGDIHKIAAKRKDFVDFWGEMRIDCNVGSVLISCQPSLPTNQLVVIRMETEIWIVDETKGLLYDLSSNKAPTQFNLEENYQSNLTRDSILSIKRGSPFLPKYEISSELHRRILEFLIEKNGGNEICIT